MSQSVAVIVFTLSWCFALLGLQKRLCRTKFKRRFACCLGVFLVLSTVAFAWANWDNPDSPGGGLFTRTINSGEFLLSNQTKMPIEVTPGQAISFWRLWREDLSFVSLVPSRVFVGLAQLPEKKTIFLALVRVKPDQKSVLKALHRSKVEKGGNLENIVLVAEWRELVDRKLKLPVDKVFQPNEVGRHLVETYNPILAKSGLEIAGVQVIN